jgi:hypothetical protein
MATGLFDCSLKFDHQKDFLGLCQIAPIHEYAPIVAQLNMPGVSARSDCAVRTGHPPTGHSSTNSQSRSAARDGFAH